MDSMSYEDRIQAAFAELDSAKSINYTQAALNWGLERSTLSRRHRKITRSREQFLDESLRKLTTTQETALVDYLLQIGKRGIWTTPRIIRNLVQETLNELIGKNWVTRFVERHSNQITTVYLNGLDKNRRAAESVANTAKFYENVCIKSLKMC
jgi:hypothetical protein